MCNVFGGKYWLNVGPAKANRASFKAVKREMVAAESADFSILEAAAGE